MFHRNIKGSWGRRCLYFALLPLVLESFKRCLLLLAALTGLIDTPLRSCYLEGLYYDCLWRGDKGCWHSNISSVQHRWPDLCHYIYCFVQSGKVFTVKGNKHTHARTHARTHTYARRHTDTHRHTQTHKDTHTHTHTHTHFIKTYYIWNSIFITNFPLLRDSPWPTVIDWHLQLYWQYCRQHLLKEYQWSWSTPS